MVQPIWKTVWRFLKKLKMELLYDPAISLLSIYPKDTDVVKRRAICTPMFIAVMAMVAKLTKEPRCPSTDEWIKKIWSIYTMEFYVSFRKDDYPSFASTWTGLEEIMRSEVSQAEIDSQLSYGFTYLWSIRNNTEDNGRWGGEVRWGKLEGETNYERLWTLRNKLRVLERRGWGEDQASWWVLRRACMAWSTGCGA